MNGGGMGGPGIGGKGSCPPGGQGNFGPGMQPGNCGIWGLGRGILPQRILNNEGREKFIGPCLSARALSPALASPFIGGKEDMLTLLCI